MGSLTDRTVRSAKPVRHGDGDGLFLLVAETGRRKWVLRYQMSGQRRDMGLGAYPAVGLSKARLSAGDAVGRFPPALIRSPPSVLWKGRRSHCRPSERLRRDHHP
jgi:hypothetical protein